MQPSIAERFVFGRPYDPGAADTLAPVVPRSTLALIGRILMSAIFILSGISKFADPASTIGYMSSAGVPRPDILVYVAAVWWCVAVLLGLWLGRRPETTEGIGTLLADARSTNSLPELEPGALLFNRLWPVLVATVLTGAVGFFFPQVPVVATGFFLLVGLLWRRQSSAV